MAISNGVQCPQLNSGLGTSHGWLSSMWIERSDTLIHALGYNTTLFAGQSEGWYVLILVPKKLEDLETFNAVLQRGAGESNQEGVGASLIGGVRGALNLDVPPGDFIRAEHFLQLASIKHGKCGQEGSKNLQKINLPCNDQF